LVESPCVISGAVGKDGDRGDISQCLGGGNVGFAHRTVIDV
jgi:hypothetical protein